MGDRTNNKTCHDRVAGLCEYISDKWHRFCRWVSVNVPLFCRRMRSRSWKISFKKCFCCWKRDESKRSKKKPLDEIDEVFDDIPEEILTKLPKDHKLRKREVTVVTVNDLSQSQAVAIERENSAKRIPKLLKVKRNVIKEEEDEDNIIEEQTKNTNPIASLSDTEKTEIEQKNMEANDVNALKVEKSTTDTEEDLEEIKREETPKTPAGLSSDVEDNITLRATEPEPEENTEVTKNIEVKEVKTVITNEERFKENLEDNLIVLSKLKNGEKIWIHEESDKITVDNSYGQFAWRWSYGQSKKKTVDYIKRMIDTANLLASIDDKYNDLIKNAKSGIKCLATTYKGYDEGKELEKYLSDSE